MEISKKLEGTSLVITLSGRLDTTTAPSFESVINNSLAGITDLTIDLKDLEYVSSAGLRVFLIAQKTMNNQGKMIITNANDSIREIFEITGFVDILTIA